MKPRRVAACALPNLLSAHANCDYAVTTAITPVDVRTTDVEPGCGPESAAVATA